MRGKIALVVATAAILMLVLSIPSGAAAKMKVKCWFNLRPGRPGL